MIKLDGVSEQTVQGLKPCPFCGSSEPICINKVLCYTATKKMLKCCLCPFRADCRLKIERNENNERKRKAD